MDEIIKKIEQKEKQLQLAEGEHRAWSSGKYKSSSNATMSKLLVDSLRKEIADLHKKLAGLGGQPPSR